MVTLKDAMKVAEALAIDVSPVSVILFGSVAREGRGTDLDFLVLTEQEVTHQKVVECLREKQRHMAMDYFLTTVDQMTDLVRKGSPFLDMVLREGRILFMKDAVRQWVELAREDLSQAEFLNQGEYYRGACFAAQQAVEKAVKAELLKRGWQLERIHNIRRLTHLLEEFGFSVECAEDDLDFMDNIYRGRYPAEEGLLPLSAPKAEDSARGIRIAKLILGQIPVLR